MNFINIRIIKNNINLSDSLLEIILQVHNASMFLQKSKKSLKRPRIPLQGKGLTKGYWKEELGNMKNLMQMELHNAMADIGYGNIYNNMESPAIKVART